MFQHFESEPSCRSVLLARVIGTDQERQTRSGDVLSGMSEDESRARGDLAAALENRQITVECKPPERNNNLYLPQKFEFTLQVGAAVAHLLGQRLVIRGRTADGRRNVRVCQTEPVRAADTLRLRSKTGTVQRSEEEIARAVSGEHAAGTVGSVRSGREPQNEQPRLGIAERGHRPAPVFLIAIGPPLLGRDMSTVRHQPRAAGTLDHLLLEEAQRLLRTHISILP